MGQSYFIRRSFYCSLYRFSYDVVLRLGSVQRGDLRLLCSAGRASPLPRDHRQSPRVSGREGCNSRRGTPREMYEEELLLCDQTQPTEE